MEIKTLRDLKNMLNTITDDKVLDKTIKYCFEEDGSSVICDGAWFDLQYFGYGDINDIVFPTITICKLKEDVFSHEGRTPWTVLSYWLEETEEF